MSDGVMHQSRTCKLVVFRSQMCFAWFFCPYIIFLNRISLLHKEFRIFLNNKGICFLFKKQKNETLITLPSNFHGPTLCWAADLLNGGSVLQQSHLHSCISPAKSHRHLSLQPLLQRIVRLQRSFRGQCTSYTPSRSIFLKHSLHWIQNKRKQNLIFTQSK